MNEPKLMLGNELREEFDKRFEKKNCKCIKCNDCKEMDELAHELLLRNKES